VVCSLPGPVNPNCPPIPGPDADFGEAPMLLTVLLPKRGLTDILVTGQKSGFVWGLDAQTGSVIWATVSYCEQRNSS
jgi:hypothetical protein